MARVSPGNHLSCRGRGSAVGPRRNPTKTRVLLSRAWPAHVSPTFSMGKPGYFSQSGAGLGAVKLYLELGLVAAAWGWWQPLGVPLHPAPNLRTRRRRMGLVGGFRLRKDSDQISWSSADISRSVIYPKYLKTFLGGEVALVSLSEPVLSASSPRCFCALPSLMSLCNPGRPAVVLLAW